MDIKFDIKKLNFRNPPKPVKIIVVVLPIITIIALAVFLVVIPKKKEIDKLAKVIAQQETTISKNQAMAAKLKELKAENVKLKEKLLELEDQLPTEGEISTLLKQVTGLTKEAGLDIMSWNPSLQKRGHPSGIVYEIPFRIVLTGSYHKLGLFFSSLTQLKRIVNINSITLSGPKVKGSITELNVNFEAVTFVAVPERKIQ